MKRSLLFFLGLALLIAINPINSFGYGAGRAGNTGSPGSQTCTQCHSGTVNTGPGSVTITSNIPGWQYSPGQTYTINVTVSQTGLPLFSLGVEALSGSGTYANAGTFVITNTSETQIKSRSVGGFSRNNVVQVDNGGLAANSKTFTFNWTAPASNVGDVTFYVCGLACDNDGGTDNDFSYTISQVVPFMSAAAPVANFNASNTTICQGASISFTDQSTNTPTSWAWDFGDGQTSTEQNPTHIYNTAGTYTVALTATNAGGSNTSTQSNLITVNPTVVPAISLPGSTTSVCPGTTQTITATPTNGGTPVFAWTVDGNPVGTNSDTYSAVFTNGQSVVCTMTSNAACATPATVTSNTYITGIYTVAPVTITETTGTVNSDATSGNQWYDASGMIAGANSASYVPTANGNYYTIVTDANGCTSTSNTISFTLAVNSLYSSETINIYPNPVKDNVTITFGNTLTGQFIIEDFSGRIVYSEKLNQKSGSVKAVDMSNYTSGFYFFKLNNQKYKVIKEK